MIPVLPLRCAHSQWKAIKHERKGVIWKSLAYRSSFSKNRPRQVGRVCCSCQMPAKSSLESSANFKFVFTRLISEENIKRVLCCQHDECSSSPTACSTTHFTEKCFNQLKCCLLNPFHQFQLLSVRMAS